MLFTNEIKLISERGIPIYDFRNNNLIHYFYDESVTNKLAYILFNYQSPTSYYYDYRGNMTYDGLKNITITNYDHRNLPLQMTLGG